MYNAAPPAEALTWSPPFKTPSPPPGTSPAHSILWVILFPPLARKPEGVTVPSQATGTRGETWVLAGRGVPTQGGCCLPCPPCCSREGCPALAQTRGVQALFTALQSGGELKPTRVPTKQRENKQLFRSAAPTCSCFAQLPIRCKSR